MVADGFALEGGVVLGKAVESLEVLKFLPHERQNTSSESSCCPQEHVCTSLRGDAGVFRGGGR